MGFDALHEALPGRGGRHVAGGAGEETNAEPLLQRPDRMTEGRSGDAQPGGRSREAPLPGDLEEGAHLAEFVPRHW